MVVLVAFFVGVYAVSSHQQVHRRVLRFRWVFAGAIVVAASLYSLRVVQ
jgi:hypothetical protein